MVKILIAAIYKGCFVGVCKLALLFGLLPAPFRATTHGEVFTKRFRLYTLYSVIVHVLFLAVMPVSMMFSRDVKHSSINQERNPVISAASYLSEYLQIFYVLMMMRDVWWLRNEYREAYAKYRQWAERMQAYWRETRIPNHPGRRRAITRLVQSFVVQWIGVVLSNHFIASFVVMYMRPLNDIRSVFIFVVNYQHLLFWLLPVFLFTFVMSKLWEHFAHINMILAEMLHLLNDVSRPMSSEALTRVADELTTLFSLHMQLRGIAVDAMRLFNVPFLINLAQWFMGNVRMFQVVMYSVTGIFSYRIFWVIPVTNVIQHCDTWYMIQNVENVLGACNSTGELLVEFNKVAAVHQNKDFRQTMETFCSYLRCHKLKFMVCGLFDFSRRSSFGYIAAIIMQVTVVMQFDMAISSVYQSQPQPQSDN